MSFSCVTNSGKIGVSGLLTYTWIAVHLRQRLLVIFLCNLWLMIKSQILVTAVASLAKLLSVCLRIKWLWVRIPVVSLKLQKTYYNTRIIVGRRFLTPPRLLRRPILFNPLPLFSFFPIPSPQPHYFSCLASVAECLIVPHLMCYFT